MIRFTEPPNHNHVLSMVSPEILSVIDLLCVIAGVGIAVVSWRRAIDPWQRLFYLLAVVLVAGSGFEVWHRLNPHGNIAQGFVERVPLYYILLTGIIFCLTTLSFSRVTPLSHLWSILILVLLAGLFVSYEFPGVIPGIRALSPGFLVGAWGLFIGIAIIRMFNVYRKTVYPLHRNRYKYWFVAMVVFVFGAVLIFLKQATPGFVLTTAAAFLITIIGVSHQLPDIRQIIKKTLAFILATLIGVFVYTSALLLVVSITSVNDFMYQLATAVLVAILLVIIANPLINLFYRWVNRMITGRSLDSTRLMGDYSKDIANIIDLRQLAQKIIDTLTAGLKLQYGELITIEKFDGGYKLNRLNQYGQEHSPTPNSLTLPIGSAITQWFLEERKPTTQYDLDFHPRFSKVKNEEKVLLSSMKMDIFVPIYAQTDWIGLIALGPKVTGDRIFDDEISVLSSLADQTSVGLRNAQLYDDLKLRNLENEKLNADLSEANQELSRLDQAKSDFISIASHEIRTPLTQIIGYNDILHDMIKGGNIPRTAGLQMIDGVHKAARRLEDIVDTMFDVSKLDTRTLDLHFTDVHLSEVIAFVNEKWMMAVEDRKLTITTKGLAGLPPIQGDSRRLKQVFSNIVQNAIKYTPDGGQIRIQAQLLQQTSLQGAQFIEVIISDNGIGIDPQDLERIFDKFYRVGNVMLHSSGETKFKGAGPGLGLTIARGIVEAHGGKIWAESPGNDDTNCPGSSFHVLLPLEQEQK